MKPSCSECRFQQSDGYHRWECRRFPPQVADHNRSMFPETNAGDWCGEFKPKEQEA